jgi:hypothetical protein
MNIENVVELAMVLFNYYYSRKSTKAHDFIIILKFKNSNLSLSLSLFWHISHANPSMFFLMDVWNSL